MATLTEFPTSADAATRDDLLAELPHVETLVASENQDLQVYLDRAWGDLLQQLRARGVSPERCSLVTDTTDSAQSLKRAWVMLTLHWIFVDCRGVKDDANALAAQDYRNHAQTALACVTTFYDETTYAQTDVSVGRVNVGNARLIR